MRLTCLTTSTTALAAALLISGCSGCHRDTPAPDHDCSVCSALANAQSATCVPEVTCTSSACVSCESLVCNLGFADCDGKNEDGCEVDLTSTVASCGACGHSCPTNRCASGSCRAVTVVASGLASPAGIALATSDVWWAATGSTAEPSRGSLQHAPKWVAQS